MTILRRRILQGSCALGGLQFLSPLQAASPIPDLAPALNGEDVIAYVHRVSGRWDWDLYRRLLGAANEWKEGDAIVGVAASNETERQIARSLLENTTLEQIDAHPPFRDNTWEQIHSDIDPRSKNSTNSWTIGQLKTFLLNRPDTDIYPVLPGLSSDSIACVVKLLSNEELISIGKKLFFRLPGSQIGAEGYMGARIQPNSPTDNPDDIRWQVLNAFSYAVGDVLIGTNPVSSELASVAAVEATLKDIVDTFGISDILPYCVLSHIDIQAEIENQRPGSTALWFQSIAGSDAANETFDLSLDKLLRHTESKTGRFGLYFETGQGADFSNGHGAGTDMLIHESRKYGLARSLQQRLASERKRKGETGDAWVHLNDVAGFIGPEVFRTREQLVRCCLEDIVMGKLHQLTIGLDICTTLHMDVSLDDLGWCIEQIMPANPAYLMALPTRIDPMLGYLTTGYHDHVKIRETFGYRINDAMQAFFQSLHVIDRDGKPTHHFGDPAWIYVCYCRKRGELRSDDDLRQEAKEKIEQVRQRGVFISEGFGEEYSQLPRELATQVRDIYTDAKACIWAQLPDDFESRFDVPVSLETLSKDRNDYILHPTSGEDLSLESLKQISRIKAKHGERFDTAIVISDGLNALACTSDQQAESLASLLRRELTSQGFKVIPESLLIRAGRVRAGYRIGESLFGGRPENCQILHIIGERPGSGHRTLSVYITRAPGATWGIRSKVDHNITKVVSGIALTSLQPEQGATTAIRILKSLG